jgi:sec-independent protein translocase protein TatA
MAWTFGPLEAVALLVLGLLLFGRRLPDVARSIGKSIVEFKRGLNDVKGEIDQASREDESRTLPEDPQKTGGDSAAR